MVLGFVTGFHLHNTVTKLLKNNSSVVSAVGSALSSFSLAFWHPECKMTNLCSMSTSVLQRARVSEDDWHEYLMLKHHFMRRLENDCLSPAVMFTWLGMESWTLPQERAHLKAYCASCTTNTQLTTNHWLTQRRYKRQSISNGTIQVLSQPQLLYIDIQPSQSLFTARQTFHSVKWDMYIHRDCRCLVGKNGCRVILKDNLQIVAPLLALNLLDTEIKING